MTREEAKDLLDNLIGMIEDNHNSDYDTALRMAIKALEQEPVLDKIRAEIAEDIEKYSDIYDDTCHGLRMALDTIDKYIEG